MSGSWRNRRCAVGSWKPKAGDKVWVINWTTHRPNLVTIKYVSTAISGDTLYEAPSTKLKPQVYKLHQIGRNKREAMDKALARAIEHRDKWQRHVDAIKGSK